jgi:hypothetical protein
VSIEIEGIKRGRTKDGSFGANLSATLQLTFRLLSGKPKELSKRANFQNVRSMAISRNSK